MKRIEEYRGLCRETRFGMLTLCGLLLSWSALGCSAEVARGQAQGDDAVPTAPAEPTVAAAEDATADDTTGRVAVDEVAQPAPGIRAEPREGEDWPRFLGPRGNGTSEEKALIKKWTKQPPVVWKKLIGTGYSAPSVKGNQIVLHHRIRDEEIVDCFAADSGKPVWSYAYESNFSDPYGYNNGPRCSPLLTDELCYTFGAEGKLLCLDLAKGTLIWERNTGDDWQVPLAFFGVGSTPVLYDDLLLVMVGGLPKSGVVAFDAKTGKTVWEAVGKDTWPEPGPEYMMDDKLASYSTMTVARVGEHDHLFALLRDGLVSLDPRTGKQRFAYFFRSTSFESVNAARPLIIGDLLLLSAAYKTGSALLKILPDGKSFEELWRNHALETHWSTTIHHEGYLYGFSGRHEQEAKLKCVDLKTGKVMWQTDGLPEDLPAGGGSIEDESARYYGRGSAILVDGQFIVLGERGLLALVDVNPKEFQEVCRYKVPELKYPCWAAPVLSRGRLFLRSENYLMCFDMKAPN